MEEAVCKDVKKQYLKAVENYESIIDNQVSNELLDIYINLAFLYWSFAAEQIEFNDPNNIPDEWSIIGGERYEITLSKGLARYPDSVALDFWRRYFAFRLRGESFEEDYCLALLNKHQTDTSLIPYFFLYRHNKSKYQAQRDKLADICLTLPTAKHLYIYSII